MQPFGYLFPPEHRMSPRTPSHTGDTTVSASPASAAPSAPTPDPLSPTGHYRPGADADPVLDVRLRHFHRQDSQDPADLERFLATTFTQTYRRESGNLFPNHPTLIGNPGGEIAFPSGSFPPGTTQAITSLPARGFGADPHPSAGFHLQAYRDRTNALHPPGTDIQSQMFYNPVQDKVYLVDGRTDADGKPRYFVGYPSGQDGNASAISPAAMTPSVPATPIAPVPIRPRSIPFLHSPAWPDPPEAQLPSPLPSASSPSGPSSPPSTAMDWEQYINWPSPSTSGASTPKDPRPHTPDYARPPTGYGSWLEFLNDPGTP